VALNQLAIIGDSISAPYPSGSSNSYGEGGRGVWPQLVGDRLANISGLGPLVSSGFLQVSASASTKWVFSSGWTDVASTDAWDKSLYGSIVGGTVATSKYANGSTKTITFTFGADIRYPNVGVMFYYVDYTGGGNWSWKKNAGSLTAMGQTLYHDNKIGKFYSATSFASGDTLTIQASATDGTTGVGCCPLGIEVFYQDPATASGLIVHNVAVAGSDLHALVASTSGDRMAWFKSSQHTLGTNAISHLPNLGVVLEQINDVAVQGNSTTWGTDLTTFYNTVSGLGPVGFVSPYEVVTTGAYPQATQTAFRSQMSTSATSLGAQYISWYDDLANEGLTGYDQIKSTAATPLLADTLHPSQNGHLYLAERNYWFARQKVLA